MEKFRQQYNDYLKIRKGGNSEQIVYLREYIASILANDSEALQWYLSRLKGRGYGFAPTYFDVALLSESKKLVSLAEATHETDLRYKCLNKLEQYLSHFSSFNFLVAGGSFSWRQYLNLSKNGNSDLDLLLVTNEYDPLIHFDNDEIRKFTQSFINLPSESRPDILKFKISIEGVELSIHWWSSAVFEKVVTLDYEHIYEPFVLRCFRADQSKKANQEYGPQHNFRGDEYYFSLELKSLANAFVSNQHIALLGDQNEIVLGVALDMILFNPIVKGPQSSIFESGLETIISSLNKRRQVEQAYFPNNTLSFTHLPSRKEKMPNTLLSQVKQWDNIYD